MAALEDAYHHGDGSIKPELAYNGNAFDVLYFIQLLCLGPHRDAQTYLAGQRGSLNPVNVLMEVVEFSSFLETQLVLATSLKAVTPTRARPHTHARAHINFT